MGDTQCTAARCFNNTMRRCIYKGDNPYWLPTSMGYTMGTTQTKRLNCPRTANLAVKKVVYRGHHANLFDIGGILVAVFDREKALGSILYFS